MLYYASRHFLLINRLAARRERAITKGNTLSVPNSQAANERDLVAAVLAGDDNAYTALVAHYHSLMVTVAAAIVGPSLAEDVVQDAWISVHRAIGRFEHRASLKTWLLRIVSNEALSRVKRESRHRSLNDPPDESGYLDESNFTPSGHWRHKPAHWHIDTPEALLEEVDLHRCINKTLLLLPPQQRAAFRLRDMEQASFNDIAEWLGVSAANARVLVHRARLTLMRVIDSYQETGQC